ncbi:MAG: hypothetical protein ACRDJN_08850 [Chloroflexota bacterium]
MRTSATRHVISRRRILDGGVRHQGHRHRRLVAEQDAGRGVALLTLALAAHTMNAYLCGPDARTHPSRAPRPGSRRGIASYESQLGPAKLLHGLARLALLAQDPAHPERCPPDANYTFR